MDNDLIVPDEVILNRILLIRNQKVMVDFDLATLFGVETKRVNEQVKRNIDKFPEHFMFQLTDIEFQILKSQFATSSWGGTRKLPYCFTEHGILQLANVIKSEKATKVSIKIIEIFVSMRTFLMDNINLKVEIEEIKKKLNNNDKNVELLFNYLDELMDKKENTSERPKIG